MDPAHVVRTSLEAGDTLDQIAHSLVRDQKLAPIPAIKAMRTGANMTTGEAKEVVHRNLSLEQQAAAERLWDELIDYAEQQSDDDG